MCPFSKAANLDGDGGANAGGGEEAVRRCNARARWARIGGAAAEAHRGSVEEAAGQTTQTEERWSRELSAMILKAEESPMTNPKASAAVVAAAVGAAK